MDYAVRIINKFDRSYVKNLMVRVGEYLPLPESYNQTLLQIRLADESEDEWSDELFVYAIKKIIVPQKVGYLQHGSKYTIFKKVAAECDGTFNINLMPPLVLKNCLPCDMFFQFVDSNNKLCRMVLAKEEVKNVF